MKLCMTVITIGVQGKVPSHYLHQSRTFKYLSGKLQRAGFVATYAEIKDLWQPKLFESFVWKTSTWTREYMCMKNGGVLTVECRLSGAAAAHKYTSALSMT